MANLTIGRWQYKQIQINGERITTNTAFEIAVQWELNPIEVYINRIPFKMYEDDLIPLFEMVGVVAQFRLMMSHSGRNRGFGYVRFVDAADADRAILNLNNIVVSSTCKLELSISKNLRRLVLGNSNPAFNVNTIVQMITERVDPIEISTTMKRGRRFYYIKFVTHRDAAISRRALIRDVFVFGIKAWVNWDLNSV